MEVKKTFKYSGYSVALLSKSGHWFALKSYSSSSLIVDDPKGETQKIDNSDFLLGLVFFSHNCAKGGQPKETVTFLAE